MSRTVRKQHPGLKGHEKYGRDGFCPRELMLARVREGKKWSFGYAAPAAKRCIKKYSSRIRRIINSNTLKKVLADEQIKTVHIAVQCSSTSDDI